MLYKCIRPIPFDIHINEFQPIIKSIDYMNMVFKYCYQTTEGYIYMKALHEYAKQFGGNLTICINQATLDRFFEKLEEEKMDKYKQYESEDKMVSHPSHYQSSNGIECIDAIEAATENLSGIEAVDTANIIKYAWRWNDKGKPIQDVEKIIWYATHLLNHLKDEKNEKI